MPVLPLSRILHQEIRVVVAVCLLGLSLECVQHLVYRNPMEWRDVRDDTLAVLAAFALYRLAGYLPGCFRSHALHSGVRDRESH